jgi:hypothetical protein
MLAFTIDMAGAGIVAVALWLLWLMPPRGSRPVR